MITKLLTKKWGLKYFDTGEWQVVEEKLNDLDQQSSTDHPYTPDRANLFRALDVCSPEQIRVGFIGQDPYPSPSHATGVAFSIPPHVDKWPPTLINFLKEYSDDLRYPTPSSGCLEPWCSRGVLLWNAYPSVQRGRPGSHHWDEWKPLSKELLKRLADQGTVIVYLGRVAQTFAIPRYERQLFTSHPSPLGAKHSFLGSRIFTQTNAMLVRNNMDTIKWRLP